MPEVVTQEIRVKKGAIHCVGCEATIERHLGRAAGVQAVKASEKAQVVEVTWDPNECDIEQVKAKLDELGFPAER